MDDQVREQWGLAPSPVTARHGALLDVYIALQAWLSTFIQARIGRRAVEEFWQAFASSSAAGWKGSLGSLPLAEQVEAMVRFDEGFAILEATSKSDHSFTWVLQCSLKERIEADNLSPVIACNFCRYMLDNVCRAVGVQNSIDEADGVCTKKVWVEEGLLE